MSNLKLQGNALYNVHKLVYLANEYPDKTMMQLGEMFQLTMLDMNAAFWRAEELGYLLVNEKTNDCKVDTVPKVWDFGPEVAEMEETILYTMELLASREGDFAEDQLTMWLTGSPAQNQFVAVKHLLNEKKIASYTLTNQTEIKPSKKGLRRGKQPKIVEDTYTFYTLPKNLEKRWGEKQFQDATKLK